MSTRSNIAMLLPDGKVRCIYVHKDGYLSHHVPILQEHYNTAEKVTALLDLGDLSVLGAQLGERHDFDSSVHRENGWCKAYGRDRGEHDQEAETVANVDKWVDWHQQYNYLFKNGEWFVVGGEDISELTPIAAALAAERLTK